MFTVPCGSYHTHGSVCVRTCVSVRKCVHTYTHIQIPLCLIHYISSVACSCLIIHCICTDLLCCCAASLQGQVPPNQNFLTRANVPLPVAHGNVPQQVHLLTPSFFEQMYTHRLQSLYNHGKLGMRIYNQFCWFNLEAIYQFCC